MRLLLCLAVLLCGTARAATFEIGGGAVYAQPVGDGFWYWQAEPHSFGLTKAALTVAVSSGPWRFAYVHSGTFTSDALAGGRDEDYDREHHRCVPTGCGDLARFRGHGWFHGISAAYEWRWLSIGALAHRDYWYVDTALGMRYGHVKNEPATRLAPVLGAWKRFGRWRIGIEEYLMCVSDRCRSETYGPIWRNTTMLSVTWSPHVN